MSNEDFIFSLGKSLSQKHGDFLSKVGEIPYKVSAEHSLVLAEVTAKVTLIAQVMCHKEIIDHWDVKEFRGYNSIFLTKRGLDFGVEIMTNGDCVILRSLNEMLNRDNPLYSQMMYTNYDNWSWEEFGEYLLDFIHKAMYQRQKSLEVSMNFSIKEDLDDR